MFNSPETYTKPKTGIEKIRTRWNSIDSMAGVGLDPDIEKIPKVIWDQVGGKDNYGEGFSLFNQQIIDATAQYVVDYKVNSNFYQGVQGREALQRTFDYIKQKHPEIIRVCDGKFSDIGNTAEKIADEVFGKLDADAVLLNPYMGYDAIEPFAKHADKVVILCINTSNSSANSIQNLRLDSGLPLWKHILRVSMSEWNSNGNIVPVLSATHPENLVGIRDIIGQTPILLAGVGSQGGDLSLSIPHCLDNDNFGMMISSSRGILYPNVLQNKSYIDASTNAIRSLKDSINETRNKYLSRN